MVRSCERTSASTSRDGAAAAGGATGVPVSDLDVTGGRASCVVVGAFFLHPAEDAAAATQASARIGSNLRFLTIPQLLFISMERSAETAGALRKIIIAKKLRKPQRLVARSRDRVMAATLAACGCRPA